jgi:hypothetical protein
VEIREESKSARLVSSKSDARIEDLESLPVKTAMEARHRTTPSGTEKAMCRKKGSSKGDASVEF